MLERVIQHTTKQRRVAASCFVETFVLAEESEVLVADLGEDHLTRCQPLKIPPVVCQIDSNQKVELLVLQDVVRSALEPGFCKLRKIGDAELVGHIANLPPEATISRPHDWPGVFARILFLRGAVDVLEYSFGTFLGSVPDISGFGRHQARES